MRKLLLGIIALVFLFASSVSFAKKIVEHNKLMSHGDGHLMDMGGAMVMGQNTDTLPGGCDKIAATKEITVHAGHKYAKNFPGRIFAFDKQEYQFEPCTKLTVHFINEDSIRHQWMMHGLPRYLYPKGMFHLEVTGPGKVSGTLIFPPGDKTYLVHCDISQHMEKGMKSQLKIGKGNGDLPSIPGVTANVIQDPYTEFKLDLPQVTQTAAVKNASAAKNKGSAQQPSTAPAQDSGISGVMIIGLAIGLLVTPFLMRKFKGMSATEIVAYVFDLLKELIAYVIKLVSRIVSSKAKALPEK